MSPSWIPKDMERLFSPGFRKSLEQAMRLSRQLDQPPLRQLLRQQQRQAEAIRRIYDFPQLERQIEQLTKLKVPVAMQQAVAAQAQFASLAERMPKVRAM